MPQAPAPSNPPTVGPSSETCISSTFSRAEAFWLSRSAASDASACVTTTIAGRSPRISAAMCKQSVLGLIFVIRQLNRLDPVPRPEHRNAEIERADPTLRLNSRQLPGPVKPIHVRRDHENVRAGRHFVERPIDRGAIFHLPGRHVRPPTQSPPDRPSIEASGVRARRSGGTVPCAATRTPPHRMTGSTSQMPDRDR